MNTPPKRSYHLRRSSEELPSPEQLEITSLRDKLETAVIENEKLQAQLILLETKLKTLEPQKCIECFDLISAPPSYKYKVCMKCIKREQRSCILCKKKYVVPFFTKKYYKCYACCKSPQPCTPSLEDLD
jgi:hypothetical protein